MPIIIIAFEAACIAFVFVEILKVKNWDSMFNRKPFTCTTCMGGWAALLLNGFHLNFIPVMCMSMVVTIFLTATLKKL